MQLVSSVYGLPYNRVNTLLREIPATVSTKRKKNCNGFDYLLIEETTNVTS
jgi:hypothetical protein